MIAAAFRANGILNVGFLAWQMIWQMPRCKLIQVSSKTPFKSPTLELDLIDLLLASTKVYIPNRTIRACGSSFRGTSGVCIQCILWQERSRCATVVQCHSAPCL